MAHKDTGRRIEKTEAELGLPKPGQQNFVIYKKTIEGSTKEGWCVETKEHRGTNRPDVIYTTYHSSRTKAFNELVKRTRGATVFIVSAETPEAKSV